MDNIEQDSGFMGNKAPQERKEVRSPSKQRNKFSLVSFRNTLVKNAVGPIVSLKTVRVTRESTGQLLVFFLKVAALELVRRGSLARCPQVWWGIQGISLLQVPPLNWLQQLAPLRYLVQGSQIFSRPALFLSLATTVTSIFDELRAAEEHRTVDDQRTPGEQRTAEESGAVGTLALWPTNIEREQVDVQGNNNRAKSLLLLKEELEKAGIILPERINDDELERFLVVANGNVQKFVSLVKRTVRWRETFYFFTPPELESWSPLVFWHGYDVQMRPSLVIRIGWAYSILKADERPRFAQAILSQVEYGVANLLHEDDPRVTVIMDCEGTPALGFPVNMMKSCSVLVQENYPNRLAALFVVNLPPVVRVIARAIIRGENAEEDQLQNHGEISSKLISWVQVLKPATKKKIHVEGDQYARVLAEHYGGSAYIPVFLGGSCTCSNCQKASSSNPRTCLEILNREQLVGEADDEVDFDDENSGGEQQLTAYQTYNWVLRVLIVGFLMLWVIVALVAGFYDPEQEVLPT